MAIFSLALLPATIAFGRFYFGDCKIDKEPTQINYSEIWPNLCLKGLFGAQSAASSILNNQDRKFTDTRYHSKQFGRLYLGVHAWPTLSFHSQIFGSGEARDISELAKFDFRSLEYAFLQISNPRLSRLSASVGRIDLPFGLDHQPLKVELEEHTRNTWPKSLSGIQITSKDFREARLEIGASTRQTINEKTQAKNLQSDKLAVRTSLDIPALEGTRISTSYMSSVEKLNSYGASILNRNGGATSSLEWVREELPNSYNLQYRQLFRLNYISKRSKYSQWVFQYESDRKFYWITSYQHKIFPMKRINANFTISHKKNLVQNKPSKWLFFANTQLSL